MGRLKNCKKVPSTWPLVIAVCLLTELSMAEDFQTKTATIAAPQEVTTPMSARAMIPPNAESLFNDRQSQIGDHHRPTPLGELTQEMRNAMRPPSNSASAVLAATNVTSSSITLETNRVLSDQETNNSTSTVNEPSVSVRGPEILYTGNWYAAFSTDNGTTFSFMNPDTTFPDISGQPWCCDSFTRYDKQTDTMFWFLQYIKDATGNTLRLALAQGNDITNQNWRFYDFTPKGVGDWDNEWFDYPAMVVGENNLYITVNVFSTLPCGNQCFRRSVILRLPLNKMSSYEGFTYNYFDSTENGSLRPTQGATDTMYFGDHVNPQTLRVFSWPENSTTISSHDVSVDVWTRPTGTAVAPGPDGNDWVGRVDSRITAAWKSGDTIGFAWTAAQDTNFAFPHVRNAILNKDTKAVVGQPHLWNSEFAFAYPAAAPNSDGVVGLSLLYGGGSQFHPSHAVGFLHDTNTDWELVTTVNGTNGPSDNKAGDYVTIETHGQDPTSWVTTGFSLQGGPTRTDIQPRYVHFSKNADGGGNQLSIVKTDQTDPVQLGTPITYTLTVTNQGPNSATGVVLTDPLPSNVSFISATPNTCSENNGTVTCSLGDLAKDASTTLSIIVGTSSAGTVSNTATVNANQSSSVSVTETTIVEGDASSSMCSTPGLDISQERNIEVTDLLNISQSGILTDLNVSLDISHTYVGDVIVALEHEGVGPRTILLNRPIFTQGNCQFDDIQATLDDNAGSSVQDTCSPDQPTVKGSFVPQEPLSSFNGKELKGNWKLSVQDKAFFDGGKLNKWCLIPTIGN